MNSIDTLFKLNDIRGIYPDELNEEVAFRIGKGLVKLLNCKTVAIGRDVRNSSLALFNSLASAFTNSGVKVIDLGLISTDALYFVMGHEDYDCGIMITASHNPPQYNGFKICLKGGIMLYEDRGLNQLREIITDIKFKSELIQKEHLSYRNISNEFVNHLLSSINYRNIKNLYFGIDASNGMAAVFISQLLNNLSVRYEIINNELNGLFPAHTPNSYRSEAWQQLSELIKQKKLDFGIVFDGDADRISFLDNQGEYIDSSVVAILIIKNLLKDKISKTAVVYDSVLSPLVEKTILQLKGTPVRSFIGHSFMKAAMRQNKAIFGAEHTGHYYYQKHYYCDSGMLTLLMMLEILSHCRKPLSVLKKEINPHVIMPEIDYLKNSDYLRKMNQIEQYYQPIGTIEHFDGLIITGNDFRIHIHPANTGPFIRVNLEANNLNIFNSRREELMNLFKQLEFQIAH